MAAEYTALMLGASAAALGWMLFWVEVVPALAGTVRLAVRAVRALFLGAGWAAAIVIAVAAFGGTP